jgi:hypothetical protein
MDSCQGEEGEADIAKSHEQAIQRSTLITLMARVFVEARNFTVLGLSGLLRVWRLAQKRYCLS